MRLETRLTERLGIRHPILSAPMAFAAGGALAAAVSRAGGLGLIGGGYGDADWLEREFMAAGNARVGCGFITWSLARRPELLEKVLERAPACVMLSFGDPRPFAPAIKAAGSLVVCQVQTLAHARDALDAGADVLVAQGAEAGGHGSLRSTLTLVPEVADLCARQAPDTLVLAAGGIADGRGLAAALMLGADGALMGSRFWASREALVPEGFHRAALAAEGDATLRTRAVDVLRQLEWPREFTARVLRNRFTERWHGHEDALSAVAVEEGPRYGRAFEAGDAEHGGVFVGEAVGLMHDVPAAGEIVERTVAEAAARLQAGARLVAG